MSLPKACPFCGDSILLEDIDAGYGYCSSGDLQDSHFYFNLPTIHSQTAIPFMEYYEWLIDENENNPAYKLEAMIDPPKMTISNYETDTEIISIDQYISYDSEDFGVKVRALVNRLLNLKIFT